MSSLTGRKFDFDDNPAAAAESPYWGTVTWDPTPPAGTPWVHHCATFPHVFTCFRALGVPDKAVLGQAALAVLYHDPRFKLSRTANFSKKPSLVGRYRSVRIWVGDLPENRFTVHYGDKVVDGHVTNSAELVLPVE